MGREGGAAGRAGWAAGHRGDGSPDDARRSGVLAQVFRLSLHAAGPRRGGPDRGPPRRMADSRAGHRYLVPPEQRTVPVDASGPAARQFFLIREPSPPPGRLLLALSGHGLRALLAVRLLRVDCAARRPPRRYAGGDFSFPVLDARTAALRAVGRIPLRLP